MPNPRDGAPGYAAVAEIGRRGALPPREGPAHRADSRLGAVREIQRHAFDDLGLQALWCAYYDGNLNSLRVQQKCGFEPHHTVEGAQLEFLNETHPEHFTRLTRDRWLALNV